MISKKKNLLIFGGSPLQVSILKRSQAFGLSIIVIDPDSNAVAKKYADKFFVVDAYDYDKTLKIAVEENIAGVITAATDKPLLMMAKIAHKLNLPFISLYAAALATNKFLMKEKFLENKIPAAKYFYIEKGNISNIKLPFDYPVIVKPIDNSGSRGVIFCKNYQELQENILISFNYSKKNGVLIEEYLEGNEISVEAVVQNGVVHIIQITDKIVSDLPYRVELGHIQPTKLDYGTVEKVKQLVAKSTRVLDYNNCAIHAEIKITNEGPKIIETSPRLGGDFITSELVPLSTGINMEELLINISLGNTIKIDKGFKNGSIILYFNFPPDRKVTFDTDFNDVLNLPGIQKLSLDLKDGDKTRLISNSMDRYGHIIAKGLNREEAFLNAVNAIDFIKKQINFYEC